jgi:hypothetical protein
MKKSDILSVKLCFPIEDNFNNYINKINGNMSEKIGVFDITYYFNNNELVAEYDIVSRKFNFISKNLHSLFNFSTLYNNSLSSKKHCWLILSHTYKKLVENHFNILVDKVWPVILLNQGSIEKDFESIKNGNYNI